MTRIIIIIIIVITISIIIIIIIAAERRKTEIETKSRPVFFFLQVGFIDLLSVQFRE